MGIRHVSQADFARLCDCSREAVRRAGQRMELALTARGLVPLNQQNCIYRDKSLYRKIGEQQLHEKVAPGWALLWGRAGEEEVELWWYPPGMIDDYDAFPSEEAEDFDFDVPNGRATRREDGQVFTLHLSIRNDSPPPWMDADAVAKLREPAGRPAAKARRVSA